jgi:hypothetical protein
MEHIELIILDCFIDPKQRSIFTLQETKNDLFQFFDAATFKRIKDGKCKIVMF